MSEELEKLREETWKLRAELSEKEHHARHQALVDACWPEALIKAVDDPFDYAVGLRDGTIIFFEYAVPEGKFNQWVRLVLNDLHSGSEAYTRSFNYRAGIGKHRGLEVRVHDIMWASDAPFGS